jgi:hypothetical protein
MLHRQMIACALVGSLTLAGAVGCESMPGSEREQGAVIGGVAGAAAGAMLGGEDNRLLGALIGGAVGAGGGYLVGANWDKLTGREREDARRAEREARENPATAEDVRGAETADLNNDGFVTLDEVVAMQEAGLSDREIINRLQATDQYFELTEDQEQYLREREVSREVVLAMRDLNRESARLASDRLDGDLGARPIGRERGELRD